MFNKQNNKLKLIITKYNQKTYQIIKLIIKSLNKLFNKNHKRKLIKKYKKFNNLFQIHYNNNNKKKNKKK